MARQQGWFALILALAIAAGALLASFPLQLGLDLRGGSQLTLQVLPDLCENLIESKSGVLGNTDRVLDSLKYLRFTEAPKMRHLIFSGL